MFGLDPHIQNVTVGVRDFGFADDLLLDEPAVLGHFNVGREVDVIQGGRHDNAADGEDFRQLTDALVEAAGDVRECRQQQVAQVMLADARG